MKNIPLFSSRKHAAVLLATLAATAAAAYSSGAQPQIQTPSPTAPQAPPVSTMNHNLVVLDPAHGGPDSGAVLRDHVVEKDLTIAIAQRLRATLTNAGFTVIATRDADSSDPLTTDQRADTANRAHAVACIVLHATKTGSGIHVYTSTLQPSDAEEIAGAESSPPFVAVPWERAQEASVRQSLNLASDLKSAFAKGNFAVTVGKAPIRPLDNLMCPAVAVEIAPQAGAGTDATPVTDTDYQQRFVSALTSGLQGWRTHAEPPNGPAASTQALPARANAPTNAAGRTGAQPGNKVQPKTEAKAGATASPPAAVPPPEKKAPQ